MDRSNKGIHEIGKNLFCCGLSKNSHLQIKISIEIHQRVSHGKNQLQREISFFNMTIFVALEVFATKPEVVFRIL